MAREHAGEHHVIPFPTYLKVFGALIFLTFITVWVAQFDFGAFNEVVAFGVATVKAVLVLAYFMHLKYDDMMNRVLIASSFFFLLVLYVFTFMDEITRVVTKSTL